MKILVICAHPNLDNSRVNLRWLKELENNQDITVHVLSREYPDEKFDIEREKALLLKHERIVFQFPLYWYGSPAILKRWQESVLEYGWAYGPGGDKLKDKEFLMAVSTGGPASSYQAGGYNYYTISELLRPFQAMCNLIGGRYLPAYVFYGARTASEDLVDASASEYLLYITARHK